MYKNVQAIKLMLVFDASISDTLTLLTLFRNSMEETTVIISNKKAKLCLNHYINCMK
jgi:hypothetical protein